MKKITSTEYAKYPQTNHWVISEHSLWVGLKPGHIQQQCLGAVHGVAGWTLGWALGHKASVPGGGWRVSATWSNTRLCGTRFLRSHPCHHFWQPTHTFQDTRCLGVGAGVGDATLGMGLGQDATSKKKKTASPVRAVGAGAADRGGGDCGVATAPLAGADVLQGGRTGGALQSRSTPGQPLADERPLWCVRPQNNQPHTPRGWGLQRDWACPPGRGYGNAVPGIKCFLSNLSFPPRETPHGPSRHAHLFLGHRQFQMVLERADLLC